MEKCTFLWNIYIKTDEPQNIHSTHNRMTATWRRTRQLLCNTAALLNLMTSTNVANCIHYHFFEVFYNFFYAFVVLKFFWIYFLLSPLLNACVFMRVACHDMCMSVRKVPTYTRMHIMRCGGTCFWLAPGMWYCWQAIQIFCCKFNLIKVRNIMYNYFICIQVISI